MPLEDFFIAYGQQDRAAGRVRREGHRCRKPAPDARFRAYKITKRFDQDISAVCAAFSIRLDGGTVARPASPSAAWRQRRSAPRSREGPDGPPVDRGDRPRRHGRPPQRFHAADEMRASAGYRMPVAANLLMKMYVETTEAAMRTRVLVGDRKSGPCLNHALATERAHHRRRPCRSPPRQRPQACHRRGRLYRRHPRTRRPAARLSRPQRPSARQAGRRSTSPRSKPPPASSAC